MAITDVRAENNNEILRVVEALPSFGTESSVESSFRVPATFK